MHLFVDNGWLEGRLP